MTAEMLLAHLLDAASRAPSAHNTQPCRLLWRGDRVEIALHRDRALPAGDPDGIDALHGLGATLENILLTLAHHGFHAGYTVGDRLEWGPPIARIAWRREQDPPLAPALYRMIPIRRTSRLPYEAAPIEADALESVRRAACPGAELHILTDTRLIDEVRTLFCQATAEQLESAPLVEELYRWLRFLPRDRRWHRDGLNASCMGWTRLEALASRLLLAPRTLGFLTRMGLHRSLCADRNKLAPPAPALCLLTLGDSGVAARVEAGRSLQRAWLTAAAHGLTTHPLSAALEVPAVRRSVMDRFGVSPDRSHVSLFRLGRSAAPARSPRLPVDEILVRVGDSNGVG